MEKNMENTLLYWRYMSKNKQGDGNYNSISGRYWINGKWKL